MGRSSQGSSKRDSRRKHPSRDAGEGSSSSSAAPQSWQAEVVASPQPVRGYSLQSITAAEERSHRGIGREVSTSSSPAWPEYAQGSVTTSQFDQNQMMHISVDQDFYYPYSPMAFYGPSESPSEESEFNYTIDQGFSERSHSSHAFEMGTSLDSGSSPLPALAEIERQRGATEVSHEVQYGVWSDYASSAEEYQGSSFATSMNWPPTWQGQEFHTSQKRGSHDTHYSTSSTSESSRRAQHSSARGRQSIRASTVTPQTSFERSPYLAPQESKRAYPAQGQAQHRSYSDRLDSHPFTRRGASTTDSSPKSSQSDISHARGSRQDLQMTSMEGQPPTRSLTPRAHPKRSADDQYSPRWVRGHGTDREGWCHLCSKWLALKTSAFWYDKTFHHSISAITGQPFDEPKAIRNKPLLPGEDPDKSRRKKEGQCANCDQWIVIGDPKRGKSYGTVWYRHAYKCQSKTHNRGEQTELD